MPRDESDSDAVAQELRAAVGHGVMASLDVLTNETAALIGEITATSSRCVALLLERDCPAKLAVSMVVGAAIEGAFER